MMLLANSAVAPALLALTLMALAVSQCAGPAMGPVGGKEPLPALNVTTN